MMAETQEQVLPSDGNGAHESLGLEQQREEHPHPAGSGESLPGGGLGTESQQTITCWKGRKNVPEEPTREACIENCEMGSVWAPEGPGGWIVRSRVPGFHPEGCGHHPGLLDQPQSTGHSLATACFLCWLLFNLLDGLF